MTLSCDKGKPRELGQRGPGNAEEADGRPGWEDVPPTDEAEHLDNNGRGVGGVQTGLQV